MKNGYQNSGNIQQNSTGYMGIARGTTAQRPASPVTGMIRYNTDYGWIEKYDGAWGPITAGSYSPGFLQNIYYGSPSVDWMTITSQYFQSGHIYSMPFYIPNGGDFNRIGVNVGTGAYQGVARIGVYTNLAGTPNQLAFDLGTFSTATSGEKEVTISPGSSLYDSWVWISIIVGTGVNLYGYGNTNNGGIMGRETSTTYYSSLGITGTGTGTTLPSTYPTASLLSNLAPYIWIRKV